MAIKFQPICNDLGHGGKDPGAVYGKGKSAKYERDLIRSIYPFITAKLAESNITFINSFGIAGKNYESDTYPVINRHADIETYNQKQKKEGGEMIQAVISYHLNTGPSAAHGLEVLHNDHQKTARLIYDSIITYCATNGVDLKGRSDPTPNRANLAIINMEIAGLIRDAAKTGDSTLSSLASRFYDAAAMGTSEEQAMLLASMRLHTGGILNDHGRGGASLAQNFAIVSEVNAQTARIMNAIQEKSLIEAVNSSALFVRESTAKKGYLPGFIIEICFPSNANDMKYITEKQSIIAGGIVQGISKAISQDSLDG
jgi:N-acetylmuramoyl-L-alanine amidase